METFGLVRWSEQLEYWSSPQTSFAPLHVTPSSPAALGMNQQHAHLVRTPTPNGKSYRGAAHHLSSFCDSSSLFHDWPPKVRDFTGIQERYFSVSMLVPCMSR